MTYIKRECGCNFLGCESECRCQLEHGCISLGQAVDADLERAGEFSHGGPVMGRPVIGYELGDLFRVGEVGCDSTRRRSIVVDDQPSRELCNPGSECVGIAQRRKLGPSSLEHCLQDVVPGVGIIDIFSQNLADVGVVALIELTVRGRVASLSCDDEFNVGRSWPGSTQSSLSWQ